MGGGPPPLPPDTPHRDSASPIHSRASNRVTTSILVCIRGSERRSPPTPPHRGLASPIHSRASNLAIRDYPSDATTVLSFLRSSQDHEVVAVYHLVEALVAEARLDLASLGAPDSP